MNDMPSLLKRFNRLGTDLPWKFQPNKRPINDFNGLCYYLDDPLAFPESINLPCLNGGDVLNVLAISSGGCDGAYGAGVLKGLSDKGMRPDYQIVTGVSIGSILALFAFLGPKYDDYLQKIFLEKNSLKSATSRSLLRFVSGSSFYSPTPLKKLLTQYLPNELLKELKNGQRAGRKLFVCTMDISDYMLCVWDITAIAALDTSYAYDLIRKILLATIAFPGGYPPVNFQGHFPQGCNKQLHVDAGIYCGFYLPIVLTDQISAPFQADVIINNQLRPDKSIVKTQLLPIAIRSINALSKTNLRFLLDLSVEKLKTKNAALYYTSIKEDWPNKSAIFFDQKYIEETNSLGYCAGLERSGWENPVSFDLTCPP